MIIWLASYPRSGNTLLRTILKETMGLNSFSDEIVRSEVGWNVELKVEIGDSPLGMPWPDFYQKSSEDDKVYLVKTHLPPIDDQPVIYIVRDGRKALYSYHKFQYKFFPQEYLGLMNLVLGDDYYGGWAEHFYRWNQKSKKLFLLHYEDLVSASPKLLQSVAKVIGFKGEVLAWANPFVNMNEKNPDFFRRGTIEWKEEKEWRQLVNSVFFLLNGKAMISLGYEDSECMNRAIALLGQDMVEVIMVQQGILEQKRRFEDEASRRLDVIESLKDTCDERLALVDELNLQLNRRK